MEATTVQTVTIVDGAHSNTAYVETYLRPLFENGSIPIHEGAAYYCVCYGELCAYDAAGEHIATWPGQEFPGVPSDAPNGFVFEARDTEHGVDWDWDDEMVLMLGGD